MDEVPPLEQVQAAHRSGSDTAVDVLIVLIGLPVWMILVSFAFALDSGGSAEQLGFAAGKALISRFPVVFVAAAALTFFTVRWSRYRRKQNRHEAEVREAQEQFYLDAKRRRGREDERN